MMPTNAASRSPTWGVGVADQALLSSSLMDTKNQRSDEHLTVRGSARSSEQGPGRSVRMSWVDPESGERLEVELWGTELFLADLRASGFEELPRGSEMAEESAGVSSAGISTNMIAVSSESRVFARSSGGRTSVRSDSQLSGDSGEADSAAPRGISEAALRRLRSFGGGNAGGECNGGERNRVHRTSA